MFLDGWKETISITFLMGTLRFYIEHRLYWWLRVVRYRMNAARLGGLDLPDRWQKVDRENKEQMQTATNLKDLLQLVQKDLEQQSKDLLSDEE